MCIYIYKYVYIYIYILPLVITDLEIYETPPRHAGAPPVGQTAWPAHVHIYIYICICVYIYIYIYVYVYIYIYICVYIYIYIYIYIYVASPSYLQGSLSRSSWPWKRAKQIQPISAIRFWISKLLTQALS